MVWKADSLLPQIVRRLGERRTADVRSSQASDLCTIPLGGEHSNGPLSLVISLVQNSSYVWLQLARWLGWMKGTVEYWLILLSHILFKTFLYIITLTAGSEMLTICFSIHFRHLHLECTEYRSCVTLCRFTHLQKMCRNVCACQCQLLVVSHRDQPNLQYYHSCIQAINSRLLEFKRRTLLLIYLWATAIDSVQSGVWYLQ